jgi:hypothetical protein
MEFQKKRSPHKKSNTTIDYISYFSKLEEKEKRSERKNVSIKTDEEQVRSVKKIALLGIVIVFLIGGFSAGISVYTELKFSNSELLIKYGWLAVVALIATVIEFVLLFWVSIKVVHLLSQITRHDEMRIEDRFIDQYLPSILARAALEIPDPIAKILGIDPLALVSKKKIFFIGVLYKLKRATTNVILKLFLRRVFGKVILRISVSYVSVIATGLWNSITLYRVLREARLRIFGNLIAKYIVKHTITEEKLTELSPRARIGCMQAVGNSVVLAQRCHPNMMILLVEMANIFKITGEQSFDQWDEFLKTLSEVSDEEKYFLLDLLCVATAFDGKVSKAEKKYLHQAFGEFNDIYFKRISTLVDCLLKGKINEAILYCNLDFSPG